MESPSGAQELADASARLIGREVPLSQLVGLLEGGVKVVEVSGSAGVGCSALVRVAVTVIADRFDRVHWLDLSDPAARESWSAMLARTMGVGSGDAREAGLAVALAGRVLVVLDRLDHRSWGGSATDLLLRTPGVQIVAITWGGAGVRGQRVQVPPLSPDAAQQLFAERAAASDPSFVLDAASASHVAAICAALDGLPLALELAAARLTALPLPVLAREVTQRQALAVLPAAGRQSGGLRASLEASCDLLSTSAQALLQTAAVFRGPFSLDALLQVHKRPPPEVYDDLATLVSLRLVEPDAGETGTGRYRVPGLVGELVTEQLERSGRRDDVRDRHARVYADLARRTATQLDDARDEQALPVLQQEAAEMWTAMEWSADHDPTASARLAAALAPIANHLGRHEELLDVLNDLIGAGAVDHDPLARREALLAAGRLGTVSRDGVADAEQATRRLYESTELARTIGQPRGLLRSLAATVLSLPVTGEVEAVSMAAKEGIEVSRSIGHARWRGRFETWTGMLLHLAGDRTQAARYGNQALTRALRAGDPRGVVIAGLLLHPLPADSGADRARLPSLEELLASAVKMNDLSSQSYLLAQLGARALEAEDATTAARYALRQLDLIVRSGVWHSAGMVLMQTARVAGLRHDDEVAVDLHGAVVPMLEVLMGAMPAALAESYRAGIEAVRRRLGPDVFDRRAADAGNAAWEEALVRARAYLLTVDMPTAPGESSGPPARTSGVELTPRELQVLAMIVQGMRNKEIAVAMHVTPKSVMHHSVAIYRKLGVRGRAEAAVKAVQLGLVSGA